jgi:hypothetical protein
MKKSLLLFVVIPLFMFLVNGIAFSANEYFRSVATGNWNSNSTWQMSTNAGGTWIAATTIPADSSGIVTVQSPNTVTVPTSLTFITNTLVVNGGGILTLNSGSSLTIKSSLMLFGTISGSGSIKTLGTPLFTIRNGSSFLAPLVLDAGNLDIYNTDGGITAELRGAITISSTRTLNVIGGGYGVRAYANVTNNGLISGNGSTFIMRGSNFINNGTINPTNFNFDSTTLLDGPGIWNGSNININASGNVTLNDTVVFGGAATMNVNVNGGIITGAGQFLLLNGTLNQVNLTVNANGTVGTSNATNVHTRGAVSMNIRNSAIFNAALNVKSGTTSAFNDGAGNTAVFNGNILVDATTTLNVLGGGYTILSRANVTNNGTISGAGSSFRTRGASFTNSGIINSTNFNFDSTTALSGAGTWAASNIIINSSGNVSIATNNVAFGSTNIVNFIINSGGILNPNTRIVTMRGTSNTVNFTLNPNGTTFNSGIFQTQGTVSMNIRNGSSFNSPLKVNTGQTFGFNDNAGNTGNLFNTLTVDLNAVFSVSSGGYTVQANNNVTNNGTINGVGSSFIMTGDIFANSGTVSPTNFSFNDTTSVSGTGTWNPSNLNINPNSVVSLSNSLSFGGPNSLTINVTGSTLNANNFILTLNGTLNPVAFNLNNLGSVINSGVLRSQGNVSLNIRNGSNFNVPFNANTGTASFFNDNSGNEAIVHNTILVTSGAVLNVSSGGYILRANDTVTNNGTITGSGSTFRFFGRIFINNGLVLPSNFFFEGIIFAPGFVHTIQGTGGFTTNNCQIREGSNVILGSDHQFQYITVNAGSVFNLNAKILKLSGAGAPISVAGAILTEGSTIEYNGTANQSFPQANINYVNVRINDSAGVTLTDNITIPGSIQILKGDLNLNGRIITLTSTGSLTETPGNTLIGNSGYIVTTRNLNSPNNLNVGGLGAQITTNADLGLTEVKRGPNVQILPTGNQAIRRWYAIKPENNSNLNATLVFNYDESELNGNEESKLSLFKSTNAGVNYSSNGGTVNTLLNQVTQGNIASFARFTVGSTLGISLIMEGFYNVSTNNLNMSDTVRVYLRNTFAPFTIVDSSKGILDSLTFRSAFQFTNAASGNYYLHLKHRNSLETWSKTGVAYVMDSTINYDFTFAAEQAFGNNEVLKGTKYCLYSGDVDQSGLIDLVDVITINNASSAFTTGYVATDVNGNRIVDLVDVLIASNNANSFIAKKTPLNP